MQVSVTGAALVAALLAGLPAHAREAQVSGTIAVVAARERAGGALDLVAPPPPPTAPSLQAIASQGMHWRLATERGPVHVWIPAGYDPSTAATVVFVHGYHTDVDAAWIDYRLPEQFALAGINAMFIAGGAPGGKRDPVVWPSLTQLLASVASRVDVQMPRRRLIAAGHSGAYRTLALWLDNHLLDSVVLLDAVYGELRFGEWARDGKSRRLVNIAYETARFSDELHRMLPATVRVDGLPPAGQLPDARVVYVRTGVGHWPLVTDGVALPMSLRALGVPRIALPPDLPLGLPPLSCKAAPATATLSDPTIETDLPIPVLPPL